MTHDSETDGSDTDPGEGGFPTGGEMNMAETAEEIRKTRFAVQETHDELIHLRREVEELKETVTEASGGHSEIDSAAEASPAEESSGAEVVSEPESFEIDREP